MKLIQDALLWLYIFAIAVLIGATVYQMFVIVPEFTRDFPNGMIELSKGNVIPGNFWATPIVFLSTLILPLLAISFNWKTSRRKWLLMAFGLGMATTIWTGMYFIPRLEIMGLRGLPVTTDVALLRVTVDEWIKADHVRLWLVIVPAFACLLKAASLSTAKVKRTKADPKTYEPAIAV